ncbi:MAG: GDSL-type esterase/lipase family protein [Planctomycetota bacterium]|nr:GDSL-type esterase/lipase family protein [Planctomycetota bacterium]
MFSQLFPALALALSGFQPTLSWDWTALPDNPNLVYVGRWDHSAPTAPWCEWQGSSVSMNFEGTGVGIGLDAGSHTNWYRVIIDHDILNSRKFEVASGGMKKVILAHSLLPGQHHVRVVKETYFGSETTFWGFAGVGGNGITAPPPPPSRRIEFYGDSNLAGYSLEHEENNGQNKYQGCEFTYAGITARRFNAEYHNISISGETISGINSKYDRMRYGSSNPKWDFNRFTPDVVVVNLGANDIWKPVSWIKKDYQDFLDDLRQVHPNAHIMLFNGFGWDYDEPANYIEDVINARNDPNMSWAIFPWVFEQWHGCETDHAGMADYLVDHLETVMGWDSQAGDILSGYGRGGNVANGSFETVAPFGGFGWRYGALNPLVDRVNSSQYAKHGNYFVLLENRGSIQQPNPVSGGDQVEVRLWLRGETVTDSATVTIDFRDQKMWTSPLHTQTWQVPLSANWKEHTFSATAPTNTPKPVFHTRLTIAAKPQTRVGVDAVQMAVQ